VWTTGPDTPRVDYVATPDGRAPPRAGDGVRRGPDVRDPPDRRGRGVSRVVSQGSVGSDAR